MAERDETTKRDEQYVTQRGEEFSTTEDDRAREAFEHPVRKAAEKDRSGVSGTAAWFLKPLPIVAIAVVVLFIFVFLIW